MVSKLKKCTSFLDYDTGSTIYYLSRVFVSVTGFKTSLALLSLSGCSAHDQQQCMKIRSHLGSGLLESQICSVLRSSILGFIISADSTSVIREELCNVRTLLNFNWFCL